MARWQWERRRRRIIIAAGTAVITLVLAIIGYGVYATIIAPAGEQVTTVGDRVFSRADYADALRLCQLGFCPPSGDERENPILFLEMSELIRLGAAEANISVTDNEVTQAIRISIEEERGEPLTDEEFQEIYQQLDEDTIEVMATQLLQIKLGEDFLSRVPQSAEQVHVQAILVATEEEVQVVMGNLSEGEDFASLAEQYGDGDLGWLPRGIMSQEFDEFAFNSNIGNVSEPFFTNDGYYIVKVLDKEERALDEEVQKQLATSELSSWLAQERENKVERNPKYDRENPQYMKNLEELYEWALDQIS
ncbi:MAG: peptidylprolyl isomerase [Dehalococcoidia bacterium]|nr:peptidylprolyl isomerase [Dehalococcoidia bacterium]